MNKPISGIAGFKEIRRQQAYEFLSQQFLVLDENLFLNAENAVWPFT
jgi:hypothetical protein